jgi:hypothetical protein
MRAIAYVLATVPLAAVSVFAHGPQIQITNDGGKIVTRQLVADAPYGTALTSPKSVYVMPIRQSVSGSSSTDYWTVMPNDVINPITNTNSYQFGPGLAYGFGHTFADGFHFTVNFTDVLKKWNGSAFVSDSGPEVVGAFRGDSLSSPDQFAINGNSIPATGFVFSNIASTYDNDSHSSMRFRFLGDGTSALAPPSDGIYLLTLQISSTQPGLNSSDALSFVLSKGATFAQLSVAVGSLGVDSSLVQFVAVPEPTTWVLGLMGLCGIYTRYRDRPVFGGSQR